MVLDYLGNTYEEKARDYATEYIFMMIIPVVLIQLINFWCVKCCTHHAGRIALMQQSLEWWELSLILVTFQWCHQHSPERTRKNKAWLRGILHSSSAQHECEPACQYVVLWLTGKNTELSFHGAGTPVFTLLQCTLRPCEVKGFSLYTPNSDFNESQAVGQQQQHVCACTH